MLKINNSTIINKKFREDFITLSKEAAEFIFTKRVNAIGIDYLSIGNPDTHRILSAGIIVYEGLILTHVDPGEYIFIGFPIKIEGSEGAPTRVVLLKEQISFVFETR